MSSTLSGAFERKPSSLKEKLLKLILQKELKWFCSKVTNLKKSHWITGWQSLLILSQLSASLLATFSHRRRRRRRFPAQPLGAAVRPESWWTRTHRTGSAHSCSRREVTSGQGGSPPPAYREVAEGWAMAVLEASLWRRPEAAVPPR